MISPPDPSRGPLVVATLIVPFAEQSFGIKAGVRRMNNQSREHSVSGLAKEPNGMCLIRCASLLAESGTCRTPPGRVGERG